MSLGRAAVHDFHEKIKQASDAGFKGIEIFYEDLEYLAKKHVGTNQEEDSSALDEVALLSAARKARDACDKGSLTIIGLQPFLFSKG